MDTMAGDCIASRNVLSKETLDQFFKAREIARGIPVLKDDLEHTIILFERREIAFRAANISCEFQRACLSCRNRWERNGDRKFTGLARLRAVPSEAC